MQSYLYKKNLDESSLTPPTKLQKEVKEHALISLSSYTRLNLEKIKNQVI